MRLEFTPEELLTIIREISGGSAWATHYRLPALLGTPNFPALPEADMTSAATIPVAATHTMSQAVGSEAVTSGLMPDFQIPPPPPVPASSVTRFTAPSTTPATVPSPTPSSHTASSDCDESRWAAELLPDWAMDANTELEPTSLELVYDSDVSRPSFTFFAGREIADRIADWICNGQLTRELVCGLARRRILIVIFLLATAAAIVTSSDKQVHMNKLEVPDTTPADTTPADSGTGDPSNPVDNQANPTIPDLPAPDQIPNLLPVPSPPPQPTTHQPPNGGKAYPLPAAETDSK